MPGDYEPPPAGDRPSKAKRILSTVYEQCRSKNPDYPKSKCAKIAWGAVHRAGYKSTELPVNDPTVTMIEKELGDTRWRDVRPWYNERVIETYISSENVDKQGDSVDPSAVADVLPWLSKYGYYSWMHTDFPAGEIIGWRVKDGKPMVRVGFHDSVSSRIPLHDKIWAKVREYGLNAGSSIKGFPNLAKRVRSGSGGTFNRIEDLGVYHVAWTPSPANRDAVIESINMAAKSLMKSAPVHRLIRGFDMKPVSKDAISILRNLEIKIAAYLAKLDVGTETPAQGSKDPEDKEIESMPENPTVHEPAETQVKAEAQVGGIGVSGDPIETDTQAADEQPGSDAPEKVPSGMTEESATMEGDNTETELDASPDAKSTIEKQPPEQPATEEPTEPEPEEMPPQEPEPEAAESAVTAEQLVEVLDIIEELMPGTQEAARETAERATELKEELENMTEEPEGEPEPETAPAPVEEKPAEEKSLKKREQPKAVSKPSSKPVADAPGDPGTGMGDLRKVAVDVGKGNANPADFWRAAGFVRPGDRTGGPQTILPLGAKANEYATREDLLRIEKRNRK